MSSLRRAAGELFIDHSNSPGMPPELAARIQALGGIAAPGGTVTEAATYTCSHCNAVVIMRPERTRDRAVCRKCMHVVCDRCSLECRPFNALADLVVSGRFNSTISIPPPPAVLSLPI